MHTRLVFFFACAHAAVTISACVLIACPCRSNFDLPDFLNFRPPRRFRGIVVRPDASGVFIFFVQAMDEQAEGTQLCIYCGDIIRGIESCPMVIM